MHKPKKTAVCFSLFCILTLLPAAGGAIDITTTGSWVEVIDSSDLISGAGSDLNSAYESTTGETAIDIFNCTGSTDNWRVDVKRTDTVWHNDFTLSVKRTSDGSGLGTISGGLSYITVSTIDTELFSGAGDRSNVTVQYELIGMSVGVSDTNYVSTLTFTVVDTP